MNTLQGFLEKLEQETAAARNINLIPSRFRLGEVLHVLDRHVKAQQEVVEIITCRRSEIAAE